jgi:hypothetical protein
VYRGNVSQPIEIDVSLKNHTVTVDGHKVADYVTCKEKEKRGTTSRKRTASRKRTGFRSRSKSKQDGERIAVVQMDVIGKNAAIVQDTWFDQLKGFGKKIGKYGRNAGRALQYGVGWLTWVVTTTLSFLYYDIIDWGPFSLPVVGFLVSFFFPQYSSIVEHSAVFIVSMINQPFQAITSFFPTLLFGRFKRVLEYIPGIGKVGTLLGPNVPGILTQVAQDGTVVYDGTNYQIVLKKS